MNLNNFLFPEILIEFIEKKILEHVANDFFYIYIVFINYYQHNSKTSSIDIFDTICAEICIEIIKKIKRKYQNYRYWKPYTTAYFEFKLASKDL